MILQISLGALVSTCHGRPEDRKTEVLKIFEGRYKETCATQTAQEKRRKKSYLTCIVNKNSRLVFCTSYV
jgi:hypothetical protein